MRIIRHDQLTYEQALGIWLNSPVMQETPADYARRINSENFQNAEADVLAQNREYYQDLSSGRHLENFYGVVQRSTFDGSALAEDDRVDVSEVVPLYDRWDEETRVVVLQVKAQNFGNATDYIVEQEDLNTFNSITQRAQQLDDILIESLDFSLTPPANNIYSIRFSYGEGLPWRYNFKLPIVRTPAGQGGATGRGVVTQAQDTASAAWDMVKAAVGEGVLWGDGPDNTQSRNHHSLFISVLKFHFGLDNILEASPEFDSVLETRLLRFQDENRDAIYEAGGFSPQSVTDALGIPLESVPILSILQRSAGVVGVDSQEFLAEQGTIGRATYLVLRQQGFDESVARFFQHPEMQRRFATANSPQDVLEAFEEKVETQQPPVVDGEFIKYTFVSDLTGTTSSGPGEISQEERINMFRNAVLSVFDYYGKNKTWTISGNEPDIITIPIISRPVNAVSRTVAENQKKIKKAYLDVLQYQNRLGFVADADDAPTELLDAVSFAGWDEDRTFSFTVEKQQFTEQITQPEVDVLFGQQLDLNSKPLFASIVQESPPNPRPGSKWQMSIKIRVDMFSAIPGRGGVFSGTQDLGDPETYRRYKEKYDQARDAYESFEKGLGRATGAADKFLNDEDYRNKVIRKWRKGQQRKLEKFAKNELKNMWNKSKEGAFRNIDEPARDALAASEYAKKQSPLLLDPMVMTMPLRGLETRIKEVAKEMESHQPEIQKFIEKNRISDPNNPNFVSAVSPLSPVVNFIEESTQLQATIPILDNFLEINGYSLSGGENNNAHLELFLVPVIRTVSEVSDFSSDTNNIDTDLVPEPIMVEKCVGYSIQEVRYLSELGGQKVILEAGLETLQSGAFESPTTTAYFAQVDEIHETVSSRLKACEEYYLGPNAILFLSRYHWPAVKINYKKNSNAKSIIGIKLGFNDRSLQTAAEQLRQNQLLLQESWTNLKNSSWTLQQGKVITNADLIPDLNNFRCNLDLIYKDFLDSWNFNYLMCDYLKCFPELGPWNFDFRWSLPNIPKLPKFDPLQFVVPQLRIAILDAILKFLCQFLKNFLKAIALPDCVDLIKFGAAQLSALNELNKKNPYGDVRAKASLLEKSAITLNEMGYDPSILSNDSESSVARLLDSVSLALTPTELCSLLQGSANETVVQVVLNIVQSGDYSSLSTILTTKQEVRKFFKVLGTSVDPYLCDRIKEVNISQPIAEELCAPNEVSARTILESTTASPEELQGELRKLASKKETFDKLIEDGGFASLIPGNGSLSPNSMEENDMPGPYNNPVHDENVERLMLTMLGGVKSVYSMEIRSLVENLTEQLNSLPKKGEEDYSPSAYARFAFRNVMIRRIANRQPIYKILRLRPFMEPGTPTFFALLQRVNLDDQRRALDIGYNQEELDNLESIVHLGEMVQPDSDEYLDYIEEITTGISEYIERYAKVTIEVRSDLKEILRRDSSTITRIYPAGPQMFRRLHVRLITDLESAAAREIDVVDAGSATQNANISIGYSDLPFLDEKVKDCYQFGYSLKDLNGNDVFYERVYKDQLPPVYREFRQDHLDVQSDRHRDKLLRPGGFGSVIIEKLQELSENKSNLNTFNNYNDGDDNLIPKLQGYVDPLNGEELRELFDSVMDAADGGLGGLIVGLLLAAAAAGNETLSKTKFSPLYSSVSDSINYQISDLTKKSSLFDIQNLLQFEFDISREYITSQNKDGTPCFIKNPRALRLERLISRFGTLYSQYTNKPEHEPLNRNFDEPGPLEVSLVESFFNLYVSMVCVEFALKGVFMLSNDYGTGDIFEEKFIVDFIADTVVNEFQSSSLTQSSKNAILSQIKELVNDPDDESSLRTMTLRSISANKKDISEIVNFLFENSHYSYKEMFYNKLANNVKDIPSLNDVPKVNIPIESRSVAASLPLFDLYDKFRFEGDDEDLSDKKRNSGHFWLEKFYKLENYEEFYQIYSALRDETQQLQFGDIYDLNDSNKDLYKEYVSSEELSTILFGSDRPVIDVGQIEAEEEYVKHVLKSLLYNYYSYSTNEERLNKCVAYKTMMVLGMSHYEQNIRNRGGPFDEVQFPELILQHPDFSPENRYLIDDDFDGIYPNDFEVESTEEYPRDTVDTEIDLAYRKKMVSKQELLERLKVLMRYSAEYVSLLIDDVAADNQRDNYDHVKLYIGSMLPSHEGVRQDIINEYPIRGKTEDSKEIYWDIGINYDQSPYEDEDFLPMSNYYWLGRYYDPDATIGDINFSRRTELIPKERRMELILECLIQFPEIVNNWPRNWSDPDSYFRPSGTNVDSAAKVKMFRREDPDFANSSVVDDLFKEISAQGRNLSIYYSEDYYSTSGDNRTSVRNLEDWYEFLPIDDRQIFVPNSLPRVPGFEIISRTSEISNVQVVLLGGVKEITVLTPAYQENGFENTTQEKVLNYYSSKALRNFNSVIPVQNNQEAVQVANFGLLDSRILTYVQQGDQRNSIIRLQQRILEFLNENLKIGARLMFGFSAQREETNSVLRSVINAAEQRSYEENTAIHEITPQSIFGDVVYNTQDFTFGLREDTNIFTRKRAFLGFYDGEPLQFDGQINQDSAFQEQVNSIYAAVSIGEDPDVVTESSYSDLSRKLKKKVVYSIPLDEYETKINCLTDLYTDYVGENDSNQLYDPQEDIFSVARAYRHEFINSGVFERHYKDKILKNVLSLSAPNQETGVRSILDPNIDGSYTSEMLKNHRLMFGLLFPIDRYSALHLLQNVQYFNQNTDLNTTLFESTKLLILSLLDQVVSSTEFGNTIIEFAEAGGKQRGGIELKINNLIEMLIEFIYKLVPTAINSAIRSIVAAVDPAYKDMRKGYLKDPCTMSSGLTNKLLGSGKMRVTSDTPRWNEIKDGFAKVDGNCKKYVSINKFPGDLTTAVTKGDFAEAKKVSDYAYNLIRGRGERYGYPTSFITNWALQMGEIPMEDHKYLKKTNGCEDACEEKPNVQPSGECDDT